jgi:hypothetical protein
LENNEGYRSIFNNSYSHCLLEMFKEVMFTQKERKNLATALVEAQLQLVGLKQYDLSVQKYHDVFVQNKEILHLSGGMISVTTEAIQARLADKGNAPPIGNYVAAMHIRMEEECLGAMFIHGADDQQYAILKV